MTQKKIIAIESKKIPRISDGISLADFLAMDVYVYGQKVFPNIPIGYKNKTSADIDEIPDSKKIQYQEENKIYATRIKIPNMETPFIASQIPYTRKTQDEFLKLIPNEKEIRPIIVNLRKSAKFKGMSNYLENPNIEVDNGLPDTKAPITYYKLHIRDKMVRQIHFHWPDEGNPELKDFEYLIKRVSERCAIYKNPVLITHCKAGISRTGTFLLAYSLYEILKKELDNETAISDIKLDPAELLKKIREQRPRMIKEESQFILALAAVQNLIKKYIIIKKNSYIIK